GKNDSAEYLASLVPGWGGPASPLSPTLSRAVSAKSPLAPRGRGAGGEGEGSLPSKQRPLHIHPRIPHLRQLVAQRSRADPAPLRRFLAPPTLCPQHLEYQLELPLLHILPQIGRASCRERVQ